MEFAYDGGGLGKGGDVPLFLDGEKVAEAAEDLDHLITPEERLHIAMARQ